MTSAHKTHTSANKRGLIVELTEALTSATKGSGLGLSVSIQKVGPGWARASQSQASGARAGAEP